MFTRLFTSMKVQVAVIATASSAMVLFGVSAEHQASALALVAAIFGLAGAVIVATGYEDGQEKSAGGADPAIPRVNPTAGNGTLKTTPLIALALIVPLMLTGCGLFAQPTPLTPADQALQDVRDQAVALAIAEITIEDLHATHKIGDRAYADLRAVEVTAGAYIDAASTAAQNGQPIDTQTKLALLRQIVGTINQAILTANAPPPATQPN